MVFDSIKMQKNVYKSTQKIDQCKNNNTGSMPYGQWNQC